jgi:putative sterol carrier protein
MPYPFLSADWIAAAKEIRAKYDGQHPPITASIRMNQVITEVPFDDGELRAFVDTSSGDLVMDLGELDGADLTITTDWATAKAIFVLQDQTVGMQAFMSGKIKVQGDMMKMMALQTSMPSDEITQQIADEIKAITE